jgi:hypothetical protein
VMNLEWLTVNLIPLGSTTSLSFKRRLTLLGRKPWTVCPTRPCRIWTITRRITLPPDWWGILKALHWYLRCSIAEQQEWLEIPRMVSQRTKQLLLLTCTYSAGKVLYIDSAISWVFNETNRRGVSSPQTALIAVEGLEPSTDPFSHQRGNYANLRRH